MDIRADGKAKAWAFWNDVLKSPRMVLGPIAGKGDLPFRLLCRQHGVDLCYTPMMYAKHFAEQPRYRNDNFTAHPQDRPLIVQFCASDADSLIGAAKHLESDCDAVDINLDWNQAKAAATGTSPSDGPFGAVLQDEWGRVVDIVQQASSSIKVPVTCKMRLFSTIEESVARALELEAAGCMVLTVHGRNRHQRLSQGTRGVSDWSAIAEIKKALSIPVIASGSIVTDTDVELCREVTNADALMSCEALLHNPSFFKGEHPFVYDIGRSYLALCKEVMLPPPSVVRAHLADFFYIGLLQYSAIRSQLGSAYTPHSFKLVLDEIEKLPCQEQLEDASTEIAISTLRCQQRLPSVLLSEARRFPADKDQKACIANYRELVLKLLQPPVDIKLENVPLLSQSASKRMDSINSSNQRTDSERKKKKRRVADSESNQKKIVPSGPFRTHLIPGSRVGYVIGKRGTTIKNIQKQTNTTIVLEREPTETSTSTSCPEHEARIFGNADDIDAAIALINDVVDGNDTDVMKSERQIQRDRLQKTLLPEHADLRVALDLGMGDTMSHKEHLKLANQTRRIYGSNLVNLTPAQLYFINLVEDGSIHRTLVRYCEGFDNYVATKTPKNHIEIFDKSKIIYLTPDSSVPLVSLDSDKLYVIGGLVDEHIIKNYTLDKATEMGISTARLPIEEVAKRISEETPKSANFVLAPNQVFDILLRYWNTKDWSFALEGNLPVRKGYTT